MGTELTERVEDALALASQGNWLEVWEFYTLSFRESCPKGTFAAQAASGMNLFRGMLELPPNEPLEFRLMSVTDQRCHSLGKHEDFPPGRALGIRCKG